MKKVVELIKIVFRDITKSATLWRYWVYRAFVRFQLRFRGSRLGLLWPILSVVLVVLILGTLWSKILNRSDGLTYYLYLLCGFPVWQFLAASVREGSEGTAGFSKNSNLPFTSHIFEKISLNAFPLLQIFPIIIIASAAIGYHELKHFLFIPIAVFCLLIWSIGVISGLIVLSTLKPDIKHLINSLMRLSFLATPIVWEPTRLGELIDYIWFNPFFIPLEYMR
jgi:ABC-type polysaccharide/polyol phosphate export permease